MSDWIDGDRFQFREVGPRNDRRIEIREDPDWIQPVTEAQRSAGDGSEFCDWNYVEYSHGEPEFVGERTVFWALVVLFIVQIACIAVMWLGGSLPGGT